MKRYLLYIFFVICTLTACTDEFVGYTDAEMLSVSVESININGSGGKSTIEVEALCSWNVAVNDVWLHTSIKQGSKGRMSFTITADENKTVKSRKATVLISNSTAGISRNITVLQNSGSPFVNSSIKEIEFSADASTKSIKINSNIDYTITSSQSWCKVNKSKGSSGETTLEISVEASPVVEKRSAIITFANSNHNYSSTITVSQEKFVPEMAISKRELTTYDIGETKSVTVSSNIPWKVTYSASWITLSPSNSEKGENELKITTATNTTTSTRTATVIVSNTEYNISKEIKVTQERFVPELTTNIDSISTTVEGEDKSISVTSNMLWKATCDADWVTFSPTSGDKGTTSVKVSVAANTVTSTRTATIKVTNSEYNVTKEISVTQAESAPALTVDTNSILIYANGTTQAIVINSNISWTANCNADWITLLSTTGASGTSTLKFDISTNASEATRTTTIEVVNQEYGISENINVIQEADDIETALDLKMIYVKGGTFSMGSTNGDSYEQPVHSVTLDSYYIAETEVTQAQWRAVMGTNPSYYKGDNRPVEQVSWDDAMEFCKKLSELTGKKYTLPTEAQWEYAARGGNKSHGYEYSGSNYIGDVAWYEGNFDNSGHRVVKTKKPNELGIYDMSGNVWEWCLDRYGSYSSSSQKNPTGPSSGEYRVLRGGCAINPANALRVAKRNSKTPSHIGNGLGFRVVCIP